MQGAEAGAVALTASLGRLEVTVRGPLPEATRLLQHLQLFESEDQQVPVQPSIATRASPSLSCCPFSCCFRFCGSLPL